MVTRWKERGRTLMWRGGEQNNGKLRVRPMSQKGEGKWEGVSARPIKTNGQSTNTV